MRQTVEAKLNFKINSKTFMLQITKKSALEKPFLFFLQTVEKKGTKKLAKNFSIFSQINSANFS